MVSPILLNSVEGKTVDQVGARAAASDELQVFAVDVWRLQQIAEGLYPDNHEAQVTALKGMVVYTLSTASVLTRGNLPVYTIGATVDTAV